MQKIGNQEGGNHFFTALCDGIPVTGLRPVQDAFHPLTAGIDCSPLCDPELEKDNKIDERIISKMIIHHSLHKYSHNRLQ